MSILDQAKTKMTAVIEHLKHELKSIRTGRANPALLDSVTVEVYGSQMRLKDVATVTAPEPRQLVLTPFDGQTAGAISKSIEKANLGLLPILDGKIVRINIPPMDQARRKEMIALCHKKREECKIGIRNVRRDCNEVIRKQKADGNITEDVMKKLEKNIQELTDKYCKEADDLTEKKEKEVSTI